MATDLGTSIEMQPFRGRVEGRAFRVPRDCDPKLAVIATILLNRRDWTEPGESLRLEIERSDSPDGPWGNCSTQTWWSPIEPGAEVWGGAFGDWMGEAISGLWVRAVLVGRTTAGAVLSIE